MCFWGGVSSRKWCEVCWAGNVRIVGGMGARNILIIGIVRNVGVLGRAHGKMKRGKAGGEMGRRHQRAGGKKDSGVLFKTGTFKQKKHLLYIDIYYYNLPPPNGGEG